MCAYRKTKYVGKISRWNSSQLLRKLPKKSRGILFVDTLYIEHRCCWCYCPKIAGKSGLRVEPARGRARAASERHTVRVFRMHVGDSRREIVLSSSLDARGDRAPCGLWTPRPSPGLAAAAGRLRHSETRHCVALPLTPCSRFSVCARGLMRSGPSLASHCKRWPNGKEKATSGNHFKYSDCHDDRDKLVMVSP